MQGDLADLFKELIEKLPDALTGDEPFVFSAKNLPVPPRYLKTSRLIINKTYHSYNIGYPPYSSPEYRVDKVNIQATKKTYQQLGLLILSVLFHPKPTQVHVRLTHPASAVKHLVVHYQYPRLEQTWDYVTRPYRFGYVPKDTQKHPWIDEKIDPYDLPGFHLSNWKEIGISEEDYNNRDTLTGFGNDLASVQLAELLLNAGRSENPVVEYELEGEGGFRGVGVHSAEVSLYLPGSLGWDDLLNE